MIFRVAWWLGFLFFKKEMFCGYFYGSKSEKKVMLPTHRISGSVKAQWIYIFYLELCPQSLVQCLSHSMCLFGKYLLMYITNDVWISISQTHKQFQIKDTTTQFLLLATCSCLINFIPSRECVWYPRWKSFREKKPAKPHQQLHLKFQKISFVARQIQQFLLKWALYL